MPWLRSAVVLIPLWGLLGCDSGSGVRSPERSPSAHPQPKPSSEPRPGGQAVLTAKLPKGAGPFAPSFMRPAQTAPVDVAQLADVGMCEACHAEQTRQWRQSAHAHASFDNPWYRASVDQLRQGDPHAVLATASLVRLDSPRVVHQHPPHPLGERAEDTFEVTGANGEPLANTTRPSL